MVNVNNYVRMLNKICHLCFCYFYGCDNKPGWVKCACGVYKMEKELIKLDTYVTASGKYPERLQSPELTQEVKDNAVKLLNKINQLLRELGIDKVTVSSGFRPSSVNSKIKNAAKKSNHLTGHACDLLDLDGKLDELFMKNLDKLEKYSLYIEHPDSTKNWSHLQDVAPKSKNRVFKP